MLCDDDAGIESVAQPSASAEPAVGGLDRDPIALCHAAGRGCLRVKLHQRIGHPASQARQAAMLAMAESCGFGAGQHQRKALGHIAAAVGTECGFDERRQWRLAVCQQLFGIHFDLARWCGETWRRAAAFAGVFAIARP